MTSRERVRAALRCKPADRIPINYLANPGIDRRLKEYYGIPAEKPEQPGQYEKLNKNEHPGKNYEQPWPEELGQDKQPGPDEQLLRRLNVDIRELSVPYIGPVLHQPQENRYVDPAWGIVQRWIEHGSGGYWDYCDFPLSSLDKDLIENWPMPDPADYDYESIHKQLARWSGSSGGSSSGSGSGSREQNEKSDKERDEKAVCIGNPGLADIINTTGMLCGMDTVYMAIALGDENWLRLVDRRLAIQLEITERALKQADGRIDFMWIGEDLGTQRGPLISLDHYRTYIKPRHKRFVELAQAYDIPVMIHSCGSSSWAFEDFIDLGIQAVDTLQPEAADMEPVSLKKRFGGRLAFHGGFSTAGTVVNDTKQQVLAELRHLLDVMMPGGGYLFSPTHMLQDNTKTENVVAVYEQLPELGKY